jgi:hypothetical protein
MSNCITYTYQSPLEKGYTRIKVSKKLHNELFPKRKTKWHSKYHYYIKDNTLIIEKYLNVFAKLITVVLFPVIVLGVGIPEAYRELKRNLFQRKYGSFSSDGVSDLEIVNRIKTHK